MSFAGFPVEGLDFYDDLEADNSRSFWTAHKTVYERAVRAPMEALLAELADEFPRGSAFRPYRDVRYAKDKAPYKTHQGGFASVAPGIGWYVQVSAAGLLTGGGFHSHAPDQVERYRDAVADERRGVALDRLVGRLLDDGWQLSGDVLKTRPRGIPQDHPRLALLRHRSLVAVRDHGAPAWLHTAEAVDRVRGDWRALRPLVDWVAEHVGPTTAPPRR